MAEEKEVPLHRERLGLADKEKMKAEGEAARKKLAQDMGQTFATPEGLRVLAFLANLCGYQKTCVGANPMLGMDVKDGTLYNAAREGVYKELRQYIPRYILKKAEFGDVHEIN